ncbi:hypothetical protein [Tabrizicola sp.]|uniref:hypothetical protein n=1 Tax=Tabrizicola sp. TaxID=2005166 RepID=UPI0035AE9F47
MRLKPVVAKAIAGERGQPGKGDGLIQCGTDTATWCFGHMLEQAEPDDDTPDGKKVWRVDEPPIIPTDRILHLKDVARKQLAMIGKLLEEASEIVNAGAPDREDRLQVDEVLEPFRNNKPARRDRVSAQDSVFVKRGPAARKDNGTCFGGGEAARGRQRADRIIGMNLRRAYSLRAQRKPVPNHTLRAVRPHGGSTFLASWRGQEDQPGIDSEGRLGDTAMANTVVATVTGRPGTVAEYEHEAQKPKLKGRPDDSAVRKTREEQ